jgi:hypothetical protein
MRSLQSFDLYPFSKAKLPETCFKQTMYLTLFQAVWRQAQLGLKRHCRQVLFLSNNLFELRYKEEMCH